MNNSCPQWIDSVFEFMSRLYLCLKAIFPPHARRRTEKTFVLLEILFISCLYIRSNAEIYLLRHGFDVVYLDNIVGPCQIRVKVIDYLHMSMRRSTTPKYSWGTKKLITNN